jgi:hypothetical protein
MSVESIAIELDLTGVTPEDLENAGGPPAGRYHVRVIEVRRVSESSSYLKVKMVVLNGTDKEGIGKIFAEKFFLTDAAMKRLSILAKRAGLIDEGDFGSRVAVDWSHLIDKQLIVEVELQEYTNKKGQKAKVPRLTFQGFWSPTDDRVRDVPKDEAALREATAASTSGSNRGASNRTATAAADDWGEI